MGANLADEHSHIHIGRRAVRAASGGTAARAGLAKPTSLADILFVHSPVFFNPSAKQKHNPYFAVWVGILVFAF